MSMIVRRSYVWMLIALIFTAAFLYEIKKLHSVHISLTRQSMELSKQAQIICAPGARNVRTERKALSTRRTLCENAVTYAAYAVRCSSRILCSKQ